jgi:hypothetical protein
MQTQSISLNLAAVVVPEPKYQQHLRWIEWGPKHSFMKTVLDLHKNSPTAAAMTGKIAQFVAGEGFVTDKAKYPKLAAFLKKFASTGKYRTASQWLKRTAKDEAKLFMWAAQIIWSADSKYIVEVRHQRIENVASGPLNPETEEVDTYWLCRDWSDQAKYPPKPIAAYNPATAARDGNRQLLVWFDEDTGQEYYPQLGTEAAFNDMATEAALGKYRKNCVDTRFGANTIVSVWKGPVDQNSPDGDPKKKVSARKQQEDFVAGLKKKHQGPEADGIMVVFGDGTGEGAEKMVKVIPLSTASPETYEKISEQSSAAIMAVGGVTSPVVIGLPGAGGIGNAGTEIDKAYEMFFNAECRPRQLSILEVLYEKILPYVQGIEADLPGMDDEKPALDIVTNLPVKFTFSEATLELILSDDELRAMIGYKPLPAGAQPASISPELKAELKKLILSKDFKAELAAAAGC